LLYLGSMPIRDFVDTNGALWVVWSTTPSQGSRHGVDTPYREGWLTFTSGAARRRLSPIPEEWHNASAERLELYLRAATEVRRTPLSTDVIDERRP
jgi:hypothetical protein